MRELIFVLIVVLVLLALTAIRYRKQIAGVIGVARALKDAKDQMSKDRTIRGEQPGVNLVCCEKCGVWVPQSKSFTNAGKIYCSNDCAFEVVT